MTTEVLPPSGTSAEGQLRMALDFAGVGDWSWDARSDAVVLSTTACQIFGVSPGPLTWSDMQARLLHPEDRGRAAAAVEAALASRGQYRVEYRIRRPRDGVEAWVLAAGRATYAPDGEPLAMWGLVQDVTDRKRTEARLAASEAEARATANLLQAIGESSPDLIYAKDREFRTIYANAATLRALGLPLEAVLGRAAADYASQPAEGEAHADNDRIVMATGATQVVEEVFTGQDGKQRVYQSTKAPLRDGAGEVMGIVGVSVDISESRATQERLRRQSVQLKALADALVRVARAATLGDTLEELTHAARTIIGAHQSVVSLTRGPDWSQAINSVSLSEKYDRWRDYAEIPDGSGVYAWLCEQNRPVRLTQAELEAHPRWRGFGRHASEHPPMRGWLAAPLIGRDGRNLGIIQLSDKLEDGDFDEADEAILVQLAQFASAAIEQSTTEEALRQSTEALQDREAQLTAALDAGALAIFDFDHVAGRMAPSPRLNALYGYPPDHDLTLADIRARYHPEDAEGILARARAHDADPSIRHFEWTFRLQLPDGAIRWIEGRGEYLRDDAGAIRRSRGVVMDITQRKRWEEHQRLLINELNHRVKNTLAVVQSLAHQTFRSGQPPEASRAAFEARLSALSAAHNLLTEQSWEAAAMDEIVATTVTAALGGDAGRVRLSGPTVRLSPQTAVSVALAMHELCTNALKYGALSNDSGRVAIDWTVDSGARRLALTWTESGGPPVRPPGRRGFGSRMIERGLAGELGGDVALDFRPEGLVCRIDAPLPPA
ncbi:PAS domain S-box protein [Phenylobacterium sp.]|jgi:PAS domain S-box-containing protein|uniref:PAS domain-containing sensor histidine kinase n=1 Tax=Phenylobacterium sp. TaxID=1871053 RepID=UPI002F943469